MGKVIFFSGAGLSADSGLGIFRGSNGLWDKYDINKVCNINSWRENYDLVHEFYSMRRKEYASAKPNNMHKTIANLQNKYGEEKVIVITQNIDNLLEEAGCSKVMHVHGHINYIYCIKCGKKEYITDEFKDKICSCGGKIFKPYIIFFGEHAPMYEPMFLAFENLSSKDGVVVVGTEGSVVPIGQMIGSFTNGIPAKRMLCNLEPSPYINADYFNEVIYDRAENTYSKVEDFAEALLKDNE